MPVTRARFIGVLSSQERAERRKRTMGIDQARHVWVVSQFEWSLEEIVMMADSYVFHSRKRACCLLVPGPGYRSDSQTGPLETACSLSTHALLATTPRSQSFGPVETFRPTL